MSKLDEIKARSEGLTDLCEGYMARGIRHLQRNCELGCPTHAEEDETAACNEPGTYSGDRMAAVLRDHAKLVAALEAVEAVHPREVLSVPVRYGEETTLGWCPSCRVPYPCSTVTALREALA